jgi:integrase
MGRGQLLPRPRCADTVTVEPRDQPLPFDDEGCVYRQHGVGTVRTNGITFYYRSGWCAGCSRYAGPITVREKWASDVVTTLVAVGNEIQVFHRRVYSRVLPQSRRRPMTAIEEVKPVAAVAPPQPKAKAKATARKTIKKPKRQTFDGVRKRCKHDQKDWDLCKCSWFYAFTHQKVRRRGPIPNVTNEADARNAYQLICARIRNGQPAFEAAPATGTTIKDLGEDWLSLDRNRKPTAIRSYRDHLKVHINPVLGSIPVAALTHEDCERFARVMAAKSLSATTKQHVMVTLSTLVTFAIKKKRLRTDNPAAGLASEMRDPNAPKHHVVEEGEYFDADEVELLLSVCREHFPQWHAFVLTAFRTGMRLGELVGLKWSKINWRKSFIRVNEAFVDGAWTTPKNGRPRDVTMTRALRTALYLRWRIERNSKRRSELVFPSEAGTPIEHSNVRRRLWTPLLEKAEINHRKFHATRHTFASLHLQRGSSLAWVQKQLGHRSMDITLNTYGHFIAGGGQDEAERLEPQDTRGLREPSNNRTTLRPTRHRGQVA